MTNETKMAVAERLLTLAQVRGRLQCSRSTVWKLINERGLRCLCAGGLKRVRESDLEAWLVRHTRGESGVIE
jgi:excisionase family DNA binding protein